METVKTNWDWKQIISPRSSTEYIVLHHSAVSKCSAKEIDIWHKSKGWAGIGYHFFVAKNGAVYEGRPLSCIGAHCTGYNNKSIGICFEGNFETEQMPALQLNAGLSLVYYLKTIYPNAVIKKHSDLFPTVCPGKHFPFDHFKTNKTQKEDKPMVYYDWTTACPKWSLPYVQKALDIGLIKGDEQGRLRLTDDKIWTLVVILRATNIMK